MPGLGLKSATVTVNTAITALGSGFVYGEIMVMADASNSGDVYIGGSNVAVGNGMLLSKTIPLKISHVMQNGSTEQFNLAQCYGVGTASGDKIKLVYPIQDNSAV